MRSRDGGRIDLSELSENTRYLARGTGVTLQSLRSEAYCIEHPNSTLLVKMQDSFLSLGFITLFFFSLRLVIRKSDLDWFRTDNSSSAIWAHGPLSTFK